MPRCHMLHVARCYTTVAHVRSCVARCWAMSAELRYNSYAVPRHAFQCHALPGGASVAGMM
eukprot:10166423-Karenia_brevis.AAC.1